jgi:tetratricopeptide (TPR) repeat protein
MSSPCGPRKRWLAPAVLALSLWPARTLPAGQTNSAVETGVSQHLQAAQAAERAQDYAVASDQYQQILKLQPNSALIRQSLAVTYHLQNRFPEAIAEFQRALRLDSQLWGSNLFLGMDYYKTNQFALAVAPLERSIALNAKMAEPEARFWLAVTHSVLDQPEIAVQDLRRDLVLRPADVDVLYYLTKAYDQAAAALFQRLGRLEPQAAAVALLQAESLLGEHRHDLARVQYRHALQLRPDFNGWIPELAGEKAHAHTAPSLTISAADAQANLDLARLYTAIGEAGRAAALLENLARQKAANPKANDLLSTAVKFAAAQPTPSRAAIASAPAVLSGLDLLQRGQFRQAEEPLSRAAAVIANPSLQLLRFRAYIEAGDCAAVEDRLNQWLTNHPADLDALHLRGRSYKQQAEATLRQMTERDPDFYGVHELLGKQQEEKTQYALALNEYQAALAKRPDLAGIRYAIGNVYRKMSQLDEAQTWLNDELSRNPYHGLAHYRLGSILVEQGKAEAAIPHLRQALQSHPQLTEAQLDLGRAYTATARYPEAIAILRQASSADSSNDRVHYLLSIAYSKQGQREQAQTELALYQRLTRDRLQRTQVDIKDLSKSLQQ